MHVVSAAKEGKSVEAMPEDERAQWRVTGYSIELYTILRWPFWLH